VNLFTWDKTKNTGVFETDNPCSVEDGESLEQQRLQLLISEEKLDPEFKVLVPYRESLIQIFLYPKSFLDLLAFFS
jgi:hypothetical protein